jgi:hypothetical protein
MGFGIWQGEEYRDAPVRLAAKPPFGFEGPWMAPQGYATAWGEARDGEGQARDSAAISC